MLVKHFLWILIIGSSHGINAQNYTAAFIKSVIVKPTKKDNYTPIISINSSLEISFDDLEADQKNYHYTVQHCNYNWEPSKLNTSEFLEGFPDFEILNFENSFNTLQDYTHYQFEFPNRGSRIKKSGNYLLTVLNENDEICIQRRFIIYENITTISAKIARDRNIKTIKEKQIVQLSLLHKNLRINNPSKELKIVILQNNDWNFTKKDIKPQYYRNDEIIYQYNDETSFYGANEFLNFDTKNITGNAGYILNTQRIRDIYYTTLYPNIPRAYNPYTYNPDINGNFVIRTINAEYPRIESEYTWVKFTLENTDATKSKNIFVYGAFNNYACTEENKMTFNKKKGIYEASIYLKQGFYNYTYVTKEKTVNNIAIEGSFFETENDYTILAYYKPFGQRIERIIGKTTINSQ